MERKIIKQECTVGCRCWHEDEPSKVWYEQGASAQGFVFKDEEAFRNKEDKVCYIPEHDDYWERFEKDQEGVIEETEGGEITCGYTYKNFLDICDGIPRLAELIFNEVDWQYPETLLNEFCDSNDTYDCFFNVAEDMNDKLATYLASIYDEEEHGTDWHDYYMFYLAHKNDK